MPQLDLSDFFTTKPQAVDFSNRLATISKQVYETDFNLEIALLGQFGIEKKDKFVTFLRNNDVNTQVNSALEEFFSLLQQKISQLSVATLTLAFEPEAKIIQSFSQWFTLNTNRQVLFEIKIDPHLLAGAAITYNGKYFDFSIKSKFDQLVSDTLA